LEQKSCLRLLAELCGAALKADENAIESEKNPCYNIQKSRKKAIS
jgi:hypothetical protein